MVNAAKFRLYDLVDHRTFLGILSEIPCLLIPTLSQKPPRWGMGWRLWSTATKSLEM